MARSVNPLVLRPEPLLHQLKHIAPLDLRVLLSDGLLQLEEEALTAEATYTRLSMVLAALLGSEDQFLGGDHGRTLSHKLLCCWVGSS